MERIQREIHPHFRLYLITHFFNDWSSSSSSDRHLDKVRKKCLQLENIETEIFSHDDDDDDNEEDGRNCVSFVLDQKLWEQLLLPSSDVI